MYKGVTCISSKTKLNYRFHNPNTPEATADYILKIFIEVNKKKIDQLLQEEVAKQPNMETEDESRCVS
ncbi:MAG: hypothetical protein Q4F41_09935 [Eubacteriales bacterium]|nr:hypothetical protein [Eubacteriales bacterium]